MRQYVIGLDFGTLSGRAALVAVDDGEVVATSAMDYPHGLLQDALPDGTPLGRDWCLQAPSDYIKVLEYIVPEVLAQSGVNREAVVALSMDSTASTLIPVDAANRPLCEQSRFASRPHAYVKVWKHHAAQAEADEISQALSRFPNAVARCYGESISSEIVLPKALQILREDPEVYRTMAAFLEIPDWLSRALTGAVRQSVNTAAYKAMYLGGVGYPSRDLLRRIDPGLETFAEEKLCGSVCAVDEPFGRLSPAWAARLGLAPNTVVGCGIIDAHACMLGCGITRPRRMSLVLGTSSAHGLLCDRPFSGQGIVGAMKDCLVPGYYAWETGLPAVGDQLAWYAANCTGTAHCDDPAEVSRRIGALSDAAGELGPGESRVLALEWWNGNKTPYVQAGLSGVMVGMRLDTTPAMLFRAMLESLGYGTRRIVDCFERAGARVDELIACGGIAYKNPVMLQILSDVLGREIRVADCPQTGAMGAALVAAVAAGVYDTLDAAATRMTRVRPQSFRPNADSHRVYEDLYREYLRLSDHFGGAGAALFERLRETGRS